MKIFDPILCGNAAYTANDCQMMRYPHVEQNLKRKEHLNLNREYNTSLTNAYFSQNNVCFT